MLKWHCCKILCGQHFCWTPAEKGVLRSIVTCYCQLQWPAMAVHGQSALPAFYVSRPLIECGTAISAMQQLPQQQLSGKTDPAAYLASSDGEDSCDQVMLKRLTAATPNRLLCASQAQQTGTSLTTVLNG